MLCTLRPQRFDDLQRNVFSPSRWEQRCAFGLVSERFRNFKMVSEWFQQMVWSGFNKWFRSGFKMVSE